MLSAEGECAGRTAGGGNGNYSCGTLAAVLGDDAETGKEYVDRYGDKARYQTPLENPYVKELLEKLGFTDIMDFLENSDLLTRKFGGGQAV